MHTLLCEAIFLMATPYYVVLNKEQGRPTLQHPYDKCFFKWIWELNSIRYVLRLPSVSRSVTSLQISIFNT